MGGEDPDTGCANSALKNVSLKARQWDRPGGGASEVTFLFQSSEKLEGWELTLGLVTRIQG